MRRLMMVIVVACGLSTPVSRATAASDDPAALKELERHILESRGALKSGEFDIRVHSSDSDSEMTYHTWLSTDGQVRQERTLNQELQVGILAKDFAYYYAGRPQRLTSPSVTLMVDRVPVTQVRADMLPFMICYPQSIMFAPGPFSLLPKVNPGMLVGAAGRDDLAMKPTEWNGLPAVTVSFRVAKFGNSYEYDVVPSRGFNIVAWRLTGAYRSGNSERIFSDTMSCELGEIAPLLWLPTRTVYKSVRDGSPDAGEEITITAKGVNRDVPSEVFSVGWKLPPKRMLFGLFSYPMRPATGQSAVEVYWDGEQIRGLTRKEQDVQRQTRRKSLQQLGAVRGISNRGILWLVAGLVVVGVVVLWVMALARKRGRLLDLSAAVSVLLCGGLAFMWGRSYRALDETFLVYAVDGSEQVGLMQGTVFFQHREPDEEVRGRPVRVSVRSTAVRSLPPRYWPPMDNGRRAWPGAVRLRSVGAGDTWWGLAFPLWQIGILFLIAPGLWSAARVRRTYRRSTGRCAACGYDLRHNLSGACPECGAASPKPS